MAEKKYPNLKKDLDISFFFYYTFVVEFWIINVKQYL